MTTISFDPNNADDVEYVLSLINGDTTVSIPTPTAKKAKPAPVEEVEEEEEEVEEATGPTLEDAVARATELVGEGRAAEVKGALANFSVKRVSELEASQVEEFLAALSEDSVV